MLIPYSARVHYHITTVLSATVLQCYFTTLLQPTPHFKGDVLSSVEAHVTSGSQPSYVSHMVLTHIPPGPAHGTDPYPSWFLTWCLAHICFSYGRPIWFHIFVCLLQPSCFPHGRLHYVCYIPLFPHMVLYVYYSPPVSHSTVCLLGNNVIEYCMYIVK